VYQKNDLLSSVAMRLKTILPRSSGPGVSVIFAIVKGGLCEKYKVQHHHNIGTEIRY
jgi:hypothetical protein